MVWLTIPDTQDKCRDALCPLNIRAGSEASHALPIAARRRTPDRYSVSCGCLVFPTGSNLSLNSMPHPAESLKSWVLTKHVVVPGNVAVISVIHMFVPDNPCALVYALESGGWLSSGYFSEGRTHEVQRPRGT